MLMQFHCTIRPGRGLKTIRARVDYNVSCNPFSETVIRLRFPKILHAQLERLKRRERAVEVKLQRSDAVFVQRMGISAVEPMRGKLRVEMMPLIDPYADYLP